MPVDRLNRDEFFGKLADLSEERLKKVLWNLYWRGSAQLRERIESELDPAEGEARKRASVGPPDPEVVLAEVREFTELARGGAYIAGDRRVSPQARSRWRFTFRRLAADALAALRAPEPDPAEQAVALIIGLACETRRFDFFRSDDPMEAAQFVVSDAVAALWESVRARHGFARFAETATAQLLLWESAYGWSRHGGSLADKEISLADVLDRMLTAPDAWTTFADRYLDALDETFQAEEAELALHDPEYIRTGRTSDLVLWHELLIDRLIGSEAEDRLDRIAGHRALAGRDFKSFQTQLAEAREATPTLRRRAGIR
jgi:hypothetical protein